MSRSCPLSPESEGIAMQSVILFFLTVVCCFAAEPPAFYTKDADFKGVEPPDWVLDGVVKVFLGLEDQTSIDETAAIGATIIHAGGPSPYYPLQKDDPKSGVPEPEKGKLLAGIARAKQHGMRVILGVSPY